MYIYLSDHGEINRFYLNQEVDTVTPEELDRWLLEFESVRPFSPVIVIIEACHSGSFIKLTESISAPGRIIITATGAGNDSYPYQKGKGGAYFSDEFFRNLAQNYDVWSSYLEAASFASTKNSNQTPWIDGDGDGEPYPQDNDDEGAGRFLGLGQVSLSGRNQAPHIVAPQIGLSTLGDILRISVKVLDERPSANRVWVEIRKPSTPPPQIPPGSISPITFAETINMTYMETIDSFEMDIIFDELGRYEFVFHAEDSLGQRSKPVISYVDVGKNVYLPVIVR